MNRPDHAAEIAKTAAEVLALPPNAAALLESELRHRFGGRRLRIPERAPVTYEQIDAQLRRGVTVAQMVPDLGVSRSSIYRLLRGGRRGRI